VIVPRGAQSSSRRLRSRSDLPTIILHWFLAVTLVVSLATGLQVSASSPDAYWSEKLRHMLPQGAVFSWHLYSAAALCFSSIAYLSFLWRAGVFARVRPRISSLTAPRHNARWQGINRALYWVAFACIAIEAVTGSMLYFAPGLLATQMIAAVHLWAAWLLIGYTVMHVLAQFLLGGTRQILKILTPRVAYLGAAIFAFGISAVVTAVLLPVNRSLIEPLTLSRVTEAPEIDGHPDDHVWQKAMPVEIRTTGGMNLPGGEVTVRVRGLHDELSAYFLFEWRDSTRSQKHLPLLKTADGWKVLEKQYAKHDEVDFYEDKFAVMLSTSAEIGGGASQLGPTPLSGKPGSPHQRGLHYTTDGRIVDVWHWKSVRTGPLRQMDDNYFGPPLPSSEKTGERYTGGYTQDPKEGGGYDQNWIKLESSAFVTPKRLPKELDQVQARFAGDKLDPSRSDVGQWWMQLEETVPYTEELDRYPVGTVLPSVIIDKPFAGDRGDVTAVGSWKDGWWRLEVRRRLDTHSEFDLPITSGIYLWVAVFDHNQTRHSRHLHPVRIEKE
jgi:cytochrome b subunit of formate dehydrogenase